MDHWSTDALVIFAMLLVSVLHVNCDPTLSNERVVFDTDFGEIEFAFLPEVAPVTAAHIFKLCTLGGYTSNHFFRVDKGFVAQTAAVNSGRTRKQNPDLREEAEKTIPLEVKPDVKHVAGVLSMGRYDDPNSGTSSFSILLGNAPHLDMKYTIFAKVTRGMEALRKMEGVETRREGIFVMPKERITIHSTYWYSIKKPFALTLEGGDTTEDPGCKEELGLLKMRFASQAEELQKTRKKCLPV